MDVTRVEKFNADVETTEQTGDDKDFWSIQIEGSGEFSP
jgi:hypothetical protein